MNASKWYEVALKLSHKQMEDLLKELGCFQLFCVSRISPAGEYILNLQEFLEAYRIFCAGWELGIDERHLLSCAIGPESSFMIDEVRPGKFRVYAKEPVIQMRPATYTLGESRIHLGSAGKDSMLWGVVFSFPQLYQSEAGKIHMIKEKDYPGKSLFWILKKWVRSNTKPAKIHGLEAALCTPLRYVDQESTCK